MLRIAVVDDELAMREQLCGYVRQYAEENHLAVEVVPFADGAAIAMPYQTGLDIIMLDVDMPLLGGMPTASRRLPLSCAASQRPTFWLPALPRMLPSTFPRASCAPTMPTTPRPTFWTPVTTTSPPPPTATTL